MSRKKSPQPEFEMAGDDGDPAGDDRRPKLAAVLVTLAAEAELFHDCDGTAIASFRKDNARQTWRLRSRAFKSWLCWRAYKEVGVVPYSNAIQDALAVLEGKALHEGPELPVFNRVARIGNRVYLDLTDEHWNVVEVFADGWRVIANSPVRFIRGANSRPLPAPVRGGSVKELRKLINVADERGFAFIIAWLVYALAAKGPFPVLNLNGPQGSAKTTAAEFVRLLVDPAKALARSLPRTEDDLLIAATHGHVVSLDNVSSLPAWLSDALCRLATGSGLSKRTLYSDGDEHVSEACRPILVNGIGQYVERGDLVDRLLDVWLTKINERDFKPRAELDAAFQQAAPGILGALLDAVTCGLKHVEATHVHAPRMADFARFIEAASPSLGWEPGWFVDQYAQSREEQRADLLDNSELGKAVIALVPFKGTCSDLRKQIIKPIPHGRQLPPWVPKSAQRLSTELDRLLPLLASAGITMRKLRTGKTRHVELTRTDRGNEGASPASPPSPAAKDKSDAGDAGSDTPAKPASPVAPAGRRPNDAGDEGDEARRTRSLPAFDLTAAQYWGGQRAGTSEPP